MKPEEKWQSRAVKCGISFCSSGIHRFFASCAAARRGKESARRSEGKGEASFCRSFTGTPCRCGEAPACVPAARAGAWVCGEAVCAAAPETAQSEKTKEKGETPRPK